jgi:two-component system chemotaxis response regulator CheY
MSVKVLVVDDVARVRRWLVELLRASGYEVGEASNGREAVARYRAWRPHVVLMDVAMPAMDGLEALAAIMAEDAGARVVMASGLAPSDLVEAAMGGGAKDFIVKPYEAARVLTAVARWVEPAAEGASGPVRAGTEGGLTARSRAGAAPTAILPSYCAGRSSHLTRRR